MRIGFVISLWFFFHPMFAQNCEEMDIGIVHYFEGTDDEQSELHSYFTPCSKTPTLTFSFPPLENTELSDPDLSPNAGLILVLLQKMPEKSSLTVSEFGDLLYRDVDNQIIFFADPEEVIDVMVLLNIGNTHNEFVLMPVLVNDVDGTDPQTWFENDCVRLFPSQSLTLIENPEEGYEMPRFDEIIFPRWPSELPITDYYEVEFFDQGTGEKIPGIPIDNRSFRLEFPKAEGIFGIDILDRNNLCQEIILGEGWTFPTVEIAMDSVSGFRNIETCVPVRGYNLESITAFELALFWDLNSLEFTAVKNIHPQLAGHLQVSDILSDGGRSWIELAWSRDADPVSIPDSTVLFEWCGKPKADPGDFVQMNFDASHEHPEPRFDIYDLSAGHRTSSGGIEVLEDRELSFDIIQMCNTREENHRLEVEITSEDAYPYVISISTDGVPDSVIRASPVHISGLLPGEYEISLRDSFGFEKMEKFTVREEVDPGFEMNIDLAGVVGPTCLNPFGGELGLTMAPADQNYELNFLNDEAEFLDQKATGLVAGTYVIEAVDPSGCVDTIHYYLPHPRAIDVAWDEDELIFCPETEEVFLRIMDQSTPIDPSLEYQLGDKEAVGINEILVLSDPGTYPVQIWNDDGCLLDTTVIVYGVPEELVIWDTNAISVFAGDTLGFSSPLPEGLTSVEWQFAGQYISNETDGRFVPARSGIFLYSGTLYAQCSFSDTLHVEVIDPNQGQVRLDFPNAFSPNGDGINDVFSIVPTREIRQIRRMEIYDRYGKTVFEVDYTKESNRTPAWDGRSAGVDVPAGIYPVVLELELRGGEQRVTSFDLVVIR